MRRQEWYWTAKQSTRKHLKSSWDSDPNRTKCGHDIGSRVKKPRAWPACRNCVIINRADKRWEQKYREEQSKKECRKRNARTEAGR